LLLLVEHCFNAAIYCAMDVTGQLKRSDSLFRKSAIFQILQKHAQLFGSPLDSNEVPLLVVAEHTQDGTLRNLNEFLLFVHSSESHLNTVPL
jgi:hypothetical protein